MCGTEPSMPVVCTVLLVFHCHCMLCTSPNRHPSGLYTCARRYAYHDGFFAQDTAEGSMADYMQLADAADSNEQLMFFQLPTLLPAPNRPVKSEPGRGDARPKRFSDDDEPPPKSLPIASAPGGLVSSNPLLSSDHTLAPWQSGALTQ
jgi:hypothetical protein